MSNSQVTAAFVPGPVAKGLGSDAMGPIQAALAGGAATGAFFQMKNQIYYLGAGINGNTVSWIQTTTDQDQPAYFAQIGSGDDAVYLTLECNIDETAATSGSGSQFVWNGQTYNMVGSLQLAYSNGDYGWTTDLVVGIVGVVAWPVMKSAMTSLIASALNGSNASLGQLNFNGQDEINPGEADEAGTNGLLSEDAVADISASWGCFLGPIAAFGITALVEELLHYTQHSFTIYNLTNFDVTWTPQYQESGSEMTLGPVKNAGTGSSPDYVTDYVIPGGTWSGPKKLNPVWVNSDADFQFTTATEFTGLGYCLTLSFTDTGSNQSYTATFMFDLPWAGDNSLAATFDSVSDYEDWYSDNEGENKQTSLSATSSDGKYTLTLTYDLLSGTQPGPGEAGTGYFYNSMVVLQANA